MSASASPWLNVAEAAAYIKRGRRFVLREVNAGRIQAARVGGRREVLTRAEWLDRYLSNLAEPVSMFRGR